MMVVVGKRGICNLARIDLDEKRGIGFIRTASIRRI